MELNGALWNPLEEGKTGLIRLQKLVRDLRGREIQPMQRTLPPRRELVGAAVEEIVRTADAPLRISEVCAALQERTGWTRTPHPCGRGTARPLLRCGTPQAGRTRGLRGRDILEPFAKVTGLTYEALGGGPGPVGNRIGFGVRRSTTP